MNKYNNFSLYSATNKKISELLIKALNYFNYLTNQFCTIHLEQIKKFGIVDTDIWEILELLVLVYKFFEFQPFY